METNFSHRPELNIYFNIINIEKDKGIVRLININSCIFISARNEFWFLFLFFIIIIWIFFEGWDLRLTQNAFVKLECSAFENVTSLNQNVKQLRLSIIDSHKFWATNINLFIYDS